MTGMIEFLGVAASAASLMAGCFLHRFSQTNTKPKELAYPQHVPDFTNMQKLQEHLVNCPDNKADVLIEGVVKKLDSKALETEKSGEEGAARLVTTTTHKKVYDSASREWDDKSSSIENPCESVPFQMLDEDGMTVKVQQIHDAGGFRHILDLVWEEKAGPPVSHSRDYATNTKLKDIPNGSHTREFLLTFGTTLCAYGTATLHKKGFQSSAYVNFIPSEIISTTENATGETSLMPKLFIVGGGVSLLYFTVPLVMRALEYYGGGGRRAGTNSHPAPR